MASSEILSAYIGKLSHPIREIRERALQLLKTKLQLGWELEDELASTRELLEALLAWFKVPQPSLQRDALQLFLTTIKTKSGGYITREFGIRTIIDSLKKLRHKIEADAQEIYDDLVETLRFLNSVESEENVNIPRLHLADEMSSESDRASNGYYHISSNTQSSKESAISNDVIDFNVDDISKTTDGVRVLLFPWVELCTSDSKTMLLVEDSLKMLKSTRRCCRFIRDVFLRDFPAEIFLNRPEIIKNLLSISDGGHSGRPGEALHVLLCITRALRSRLSQLTCLDLVHQTQQFSDDQQCMEDGVRSELERIAINGLPDTPVEDGLAPLRQLPAPIFALDALHAVLSTMARSVIMVDPRDCTEVLDMRELNTCLDLVENLINLLMECVTEHFWSVEHNVRTHRDISHKSCMAMRLLGDLLDKYSRAFHKESARGPYRAAWLRLARLGTRLARWAQAGPPPPAALQAALQAAQLDPATHLFYPDLTLQLAQTMQNSRISVDQEYKSKFRELTKLFNSMEEAVAFMKDKNSCRSSKQVLTYIKNALPMLELLQSDTFLNDIADILLKRAKDLNLNDSDWSEARLIALKLMAHNLDWVRSKFYARLAETVRTALVGDEVNQIENEKCLTLLCDVGMLTEICCHGLSSTTKEVEIRAAEIMLYLLRGRLILSESCWWRLLASLLPVMPLFQVYAAHDTHLGKAICKSLERDIAECMGVSRTEIICGLARLMFVRCVAVQLDAAHDLCKILDDDRYLPPKETLRADILLNALKRIEPQDFNVDFTSSPSKTTQTTGLEQILEVLKQDIVLDNQGEVPEFCRELPALEASLRRSTLQQLAVMMRQQDLHEAFLHLDGVRIVFAILRMSLTVDDYLAFPECAISCVSILNSVSFASRHTLSKIPDLPALLIRVILVFPANDSAVLMSAQLLAMVVWAGFVLQELDSSRHRVPALPLNVTERTALPFNVNSYWSTSPNLEHSYVEWLLSEEEWRSAVRVRWWCAVEGSPRSLLQAALPLSGPLGSLRPTSRDVALLRSASPLQAASNALVDLQNATTHRQVNDALSLLESYTHLVPQSAVNVEEWGALPWQHVRRFLCAPPASSRDAALLVSLLHFLICYMDNVPSSGYSMSWIMSYFVGNEATVLSLLSRDQLYPQQSPQDAIEVTQLHIHIVKVLLRCVLFMEHHGNYDTNKMESLVKILLACLERVDLKNFHMLGYLNELMRCIRFALNSRYCKLSEDTVISCMKLMTRTLGGCASGGGRKGQACRLDAMLSVLALLQQIHEESIPVQRWSEAWSAEAVRAIIKGGAHGGLRAASLQAAAALALHAHMLPHLLQAIEGESLSQFALQIFCQRDEANVVRTAAADLLTAVTSRVSSRTDVLESDVLVQLNDNNFLENCLDILVEFCNAKEYNHCIDMNVSLSMLERRSQLEVRARKCGDVNVSPATVTYRDRVPPTAGLVAALADVLCNVCAFTRCPVHDWTERGIYRLLFRCASWSDGSVSEVHKVRTNACRALVAAAPHKCVRTSLAATKDCLHSLINTLKPLHEDITDVHVISSRTQALLLLASLLPERAASDTVWMEFRNGEPLQVFRLLLQCLESDDLVFQDAGLSCLTQLVQSAVHKKHIDNTNDTSCVEYYDNLKSPFIDAEVDLMCAGDSARSDGCQPEYIAEELCKALFNLYQKLTLENSTKYELSEDERWRRVCSCLSSVLSISPRSRDYGVHRQLPRMLLAGLQAVRDHLSVLGKPVEVIKNANQNPVLCTLYWLLTVMDCSMVECQSAKESFADENMAVSLNRLWPWCMMTDQLRLAALHLVYTFANDCPKAWGAMCMCVGGRTLINEVCAVCVREAALFARPRPDRLLLLSLQTIRRCVGHHHCRAIILKSEVVSSMFKLSMRSRGAGGGIVAVRWAATVEALARHAEGAAAIIGQRLAPAVLPPALRARLLPALAHVAHHHRHTFLQSHDLLELLSGTLLAGDTAEVVSAARAVWALAANNHKAKLQLRSAGVSAAVHSALQRCQRSPSDPGAQRAVQLLAYTNTILAT